jgi:ribosomal protein S18 acetylase RimI-like enzyme
MVEFRDMTARDAMDVGRLHAATITKGFLAWLGVRFLRQLYLGIAVDEGSRVWVAANESGVLGFCAYSRDVGRMYKRILRARFFKLGFASLPYSLNPMVIIEALDTLRYPAKQCKGELPPAEILSIGVAERARGTGAGKRLLEIGFGRSRRAGRHQGAGRREARGREPVLPGMWVYPSS